LERATLSGNVAGGLQSPVRGMGDRWGARAAESKILYKRTVINNLTLYSFYGVIHLLD
jgi:hypothetical protein